jgi:hypothetical protein
MQAQEFIVLGKGYLSTRIKGGNVPVRNPGKCTVGKLYIFICISFNNRLIKRRSLKES